MGALLVVRYDQPDAVVYQVLHALLAAWRSHLSKAPLHPDCGHCYDGHFANGLGTEHRNNSWSWIDHLMSPMSWCSRIILWNMLWHMRPPIRPLRQLPSSCIRVTSWSLRPWTGSWVIQVWTSWAASLMRCLNSLAWRNCEPHFITSQMNGLVERLHQTIMQMIKLGEDKKANWPGHLAEIVHVYNATQSAVLGYSPHYLMIGCRLGLLVNFYFPTLWSVEVPERGTSAKHVD